MLVAAQDEETLLLNWRWQHEHIVPVRYTVLCSSFLQPVGGCVAQCCCKMPSTPHNSFHQITSQRKAHLRPSIPPHPLLLLFLRHAWAGGEACTRIQRAFWRHRVSCSPDGGFLRLWHARHVLHFSLDGRTDPNFLYMCLMEGKGTKSTFSYRL